MGHLNSSKSVSGHVVLAKKSFFPDMSPKRVMTWQQIEREGLEKAAQELGKLTAVKREKFAKNKKTTSKERLSLLLFKLCYFTSILPI